MGRGNKETSPGMGEGYDVETVGTTFHNHARRRGHTMNKPAAFLGTYTDLKFLSGLKVARVTLEIPIERSQEFIGMFGTPNKADPAWCAIARMDVEALNAPTVPDKAAEPAPVEKAKAKRSPSQMAALKCQDPIFQEWLFETMGHIHTQEPTSFLTDEDYADAILKEILGITSKRELDTMAHKAEAWNKLLTSFEYRNQVRA
jgi:hypothetical protein